MMKTRLLYRRFSKILTLFLLCLFFSASYSKKYDCEAKVKYDCDASRGDQATENFQHGERFYYDKEQNLITVGMWTYYYEGKATLVMDNKLIFTAIGEVLPVFSVGEPEVHSPTIVSITINESDRNFSALFAYNSQGATIYLGQCAIN